MADINLTQTALGTVTAFKVATVKARVDGLLQDVLFREGQVVKAGEVLAQIDPKPLQVALSQAEGQLARDQTQLNNAKVDLERYRALREKGMVSQQQLDNLESQARQFEAGIKVSQAQVENARLQLSYTKITAPIAGRLGLRQMDAGNIIRSSDPNGLVVITQIDPITVVFTIPQDNLPRVLKRLKAGETKAGEKLIVDAWDREQKNKLATGFLITVDNQIDTATGTIKLKAQFPNPDGLLFPNQFVNVRMAVDSRKDAIVIPLAAIQRGNQGTIVYVVNADKTISTRPVKMGITENDLVAIESGVAAGEVVVTDGIDRLREGAKVEVTAPFVPKPRGPGARGMDGNGPGGRADRASAADKPMPGGAKPVANPAASPASQSAPSSAAPGVATSPAATVEPPAGGGGQGGPGGGGGWRNLSDEQKAAIRKKMEGMSDEEKAEFRRKMRERMNQGQ
ncbi:MAG: MdtA/MuxA family multidrug efflux RND transporter periplasmic adaptor subunit [Betaproteobacteria bacterium]|nr:MdtA/MuxA family multidrug efflux RND transporter periplasmic adaptor subunit [Betaproteobacteria bacterium]